MRSLFILIFLLIIGCARPYLVPPTRVAHEFIPGYECVLVVGCLGGEVGEFDHPTSICVDKEGNIYVTDTGNRRIQGFTPCGKPILCIEGLERGFETLSGITLWKNRILVVDRGRGVVLAFTKKGKEIPFDLEKELEKFEDLSEIAFYRGKLYGVEGDRGITVRDGYMYIADIDRIRKFKIDKEGKLIKVLEFGKWGKGYGEFMLPQGIEVDPQWFIYVADTLNNRVQKFSPRGKFILSITGLNKPMDVAVGKYGELWVVENGAHRLRKYIPKIKVVLPEDVVKHKNYEWAYNRGRQFQLRKKYYHAISYFKEAIAIWPKSKLAPASQLQIARCWRALGNNEKAFMAYDKVVEEYPTSPQAPRAMLEKGELLEKLSLWRDALENYKKLMILYPDAKECIKAEKRKERIEEEIFGEKS